MGHIASKHNLELMLPCRYCSRQFSRNDVRETHEKEIHKDRGLSGGYFKCTDCSAGFDLRDELMNHKIMNHYSGLIHTCAECGKNFKKKSLLDVHMSSHKEKTIQCDICKMMFTFITGLNKHKKLKRCKGPPADVNLKGRLTAEQIAQIAKEQLEEITVNPKKEVNEDYDDEPEERPKRAVKRKTISEQILEEAFKMEKKPRPSRIVVIKQEPPVQLPVTFSSSGRIIKRRLPLSLPSLATPPINIKKKANIPYECDMCAKLIHSKSYLVSHLHKHLKVMKHRCKFCTRSFQNVVNLKKHYTQSHRDKNPYREKRFECDECPKRYLTDFLLGQHKLSHENLKNCKCPHSPCTFATNTTYDLKNHIKRIHLMTVKTHACTECDKSFKRRCDMENHRKTVHCTVKVYVKCPVCSIIVLEKGLQSHIINRHSEKAQKKPYVCDICGKSERYQKNLQRHYESVHEPASRGVVYQCPECPESFYRRRELTSHSFVHFTGKIHDCKTCGNRYKSKKELTNHEYSHRCKEWPCNLCDSVFQTKSGRSKHVRKIHYSATLMDDYEELDEEENEEQVEMIEVEAPIMVD